LPGLYCKQQAGNIANQVKLWDTTSGKELRTLVLGNSPGEVRFSADGRLLRSWGEPGAGPGQFIAPWGIATDAAGYVYVADQFNYRVCKFTAVGTFVRSSNGFHP